MSMQRRNFLWYSLLFLAGCNFATSKNKGTFPESLRFAVTDAPDLSELQQYYNPFRVALGEVLVTKVDFFAVENYTAAVPALLHNQLEILLAGPSEYVILHAKTKAIPIIGITRPEYYSVICVPKDSEINSLEELQGKTIAMRAVGSTSGYLGPTKLLIDANLDPSSDFTIHMLRKQGLPALQKGEVDAWGGSWRRYQDFISSEGLAESDFRILGKSAPLPHDLLMANRNLSRETIEQIKSLILQHQNQLLQSLLEADDDKYVGATLVEVKDADYNMIREVYQSLGHKEWLQVK